MTDEWMSMEEWRDENYKGKTKYSQTNLPNATLDLGQDSNTAPTECQPQVLTFEPPYSVSYSFLPYLTTLLTVKLSVDQTIQTQRYI